MSKRKNRVSKKRVKSDVSAKILKRHKNKTLEKKILSLLLKKTGEALGFKQIASELSMTSIYERELIIRCLSVLKGKGQIKETSFGVYKLQTPKSYCQGILNINQKNSAYVICEDCDKEIHIPFHLLNKALHGDRVEVYVYPRFRKGLQVEGEITKIIERKKEQFVGIVQMQKNFAFVLPSDHRMYTDIFVSKNDLNGAKNGDKVIVRIDKWKNQSDAPYGVIEKILGKAGENNTEIHSILAEYGLPYEFDTDVEAYTKKLNLLIEEREISKRRDFRDVLTFTIDPFDAKDFDDAISFEKIDDGIYQIGVHIADVSHYVGAKTILDEEAYKRGTSVYLVDRVVPMLPEILSNYACSLRPLEDKYTFSAVFKINEQAEILDIWLGKTAIHSNYRFSYEEAQSVIECANDAENYTMPSDISLSHQEYTLDKTVVSAILKLNTLAQKLRTKRMKNGAISFDKVEVKFKLDSHSNPISVFTKESKDAHKLIEEFMLIANQKVAETVSKLNKPFVYRIHDEPDNEKLTQLNTVISKFGYQVNLKNRASITRSINALLDKVKGKKEQNLVDTLTIRSMSKASYSTKNIGHYGLAFNDYTHFTSPIRRYPDILVHRLLHQYLNNANAEDIDSLESYCKHCSSMENLATSAERDSIKFMQVKYMENHGNKHFLGVISGVTEWGIYVELIENKCEGLIRTRDLKDDYYIFDPEQYALVGEVTGNTFQIGDELYVKVKSTDLIKRHLDFELVEISN